MNRESHSARIELEPTGDVFLAAYAPVRLVHRHSGSRLVQPSASLAVDGGDRWRSSNWIDVKPSELAQAVFSDPLLFSPPFLPNVEALWRLADQAVAEYSQTISLPHVSIEHVRAFRIGPLRLVVEMLLRQQGGWVGDWRVCLANPSLRKTIGSELLKVARDAVSSHPVTRTVQELKVDLTQSSWRVSPCDLEIPYFNTIVGGVAPNVHPECALPEKYRALIQPESPGPVTSQSPDVDEFVWLGSIHGCVFTNDCTTFRRSLEAITIMSVTHSGMFDELLELSSQASVGVVRDACRRDLDALLDHEADVRRRLCILRSPTASYLRKHHVLGGHIFRQWGFDQLINEVDFEIKTRMELEVRRIQRRQAFASRVTNAILLAMALLTLASVVNDAIALFRLLDGP